MEVHLLLTLIMWQSSHTFDQVFTGWGPPECEFGAESEITVRYYS